MLPASLSFIIPEKSRARVRRYRARFISVQSDLHRGLCSFLSVGPIMKRISGLISTCVCLWDWDWAQNEERAPACSSSVPLHFALALSLARSLLP